MVSGMTPSCLVHDSNAVEEPAACIRRICTLLIQDVERERHFVCRRGIPKNMPVAVAVMFQNTVKNLGSLISRQSDGVVSLCTACLFGGG
jgi:hypothetical protein